MLQTGAFAGPVAGLKYKTPTCSGFTSERGVFQYRAGERVIFQVGDITLGSAVGAARINLAEIVSRVDGNIQKVLDPALTNIARFLCSLDRDGNLDGGIDIARRVHDIVGLRSIDFRGDVSFAAKVENRVRDFEQDPAVAGLLEELERAAAPSLPARLVAYVPQLLPATRSAATCSAYAGSETSRYPFRTGPTSTQIFFARTARVSFP